MYSNLFTNIDEFASNFTQYVQCSEVQSDIYLNDSELLEIIEYQSSQLSLTLDTSPASKSNLLYKTSLLDLLATDLTQYSDTLDLEDEDLYTSETTILLVEAVETHVDVLVDSALEDNEPVNEVDAEVVVLALSSIQQQRRRTTETQNQTFQIASSIQSALKNILQGTLVSLGPGTSSVLVSEVFDAQASRFGSKEPGFDSYAPRVCGDDLSSITLSDEYIELLNSEAANGTGGVFDCVAVRSTQNLFAVLDGSASYSSDIGVNDSFWMTTFMDLNVEAPLEYSSISVDTEGVNLSACEVLTFTLSVTDSDRVVRSQSDGASIPYPDCVFFDVNELEWSGEGCYVYETTNEFVRCACSHATFFGGWGGAFDPDINYITAKDFRDVTFENLWDYPVGWVTILIVSVTLWSFLVWYDVFPRHCGNKQKLRSRSVENFVFHADRRLILHEMILDPEWASDMFAKYRIGKDYAVLASDVSRPKKAFRLWVIAMKNDHTYLALCARDPGNGIPLTERISVMVARIFTMMAVNALFYGNTQASWVGDIFVSFVGAVLSFIPPFVFEAIFKRYMPRAYELEKNRRRSGDDKDDKDDNPQKEGQADIPPLPQIKDSNPYKGVKHRKLDSKSYSTVPNPLHPENSDKPDHKLSDIHAQKSTRLVLAPADDDDVAHEEVEESVSRSSEMYDELIETVINDFNAQEQKSSQSKQSTPSMAADAGGVEGQQKADTAKKDVEQSGAIAAGAQNAKPSAENQAQNDSNEVNKIALVAAVVTKDGAEADGTDATGGDEANQAAVVVAAAQPEIGADTAETEGLHTGEDGDDTAAVPTRGVAVETDVDTSDSESEDELLDETSTARNALLVRDVVMNEIFPLPSKFKQCAWAFVIVWTLACAVIILIYALRFDFDLDGKNGWEASVVSECNDVRSDFKNIDVSETTMMNYNASQSEMEYTIKVSVTRTFVSNENDSFGDDIESSTAWILSLLVSSLFSMVVFMPILIYVKQYFKLYVWNEDEINETFYFTHSHAKSETTDLVSKKKRRGEETKKLASA